MKRMELGMYWISGTMALLNMWRREIGAAGQALGARQADVVLVGLVHHVAPQPHGVIGDVADGQRKDGQNIAARVALLETAWANAGSLANRRTG